MSAASSAQTGQPALPFTDTYRAELDQLDVLDLIDNAPSI